MVDSSFGGRVCPTDLSTMPLLFDTTEDRYENVVNIHGRKQFEDEEIDIEYWKVENGSKKVAKNVTDNCNRMA